MTTYTSHNRLTGQNTDHEVETAVALSRSHPHILKAAWHAVETLADRNAIDPTEAAAVARFTVAPSLALAVESGGHWLDDEDEIRARTWSIARSAVAAVCSWQAQAKHAALSLEALADQGLTYGTDQVDAIQIDRTEAPRPDACTRQTTADTVAGILARVAYGRTPQPGDDPQAMLDHIHTTPSKRRAALTMLLDAETAWQAWHADPANAALPGRRPTLAGALIADQGINPKSSEAKALRRRLEAARDALTPAAVDAQRDAWRIGTRATNERRRTWTPGTLATAAQDAALTTYEGTRAARQASAGHPSPIVTYRPAERAVEARYADGTIIARVEVDDPEQARAAVRLLAVKVAQIADDTQPEERPQIDRAAERSPHVGLDRAPAVDRTQASRSHKQPAPRKRSKGGQTGPTVPARLSR